MDEKEIMKHTIDSLECILVRFVDCKNNPDDIICVIKYIEENLNNLEKLNYDKKEVLTLIKEEKTSEIAVNTMEMYVNIIDIIFEINKGNIRREKIILKLKKLLSDNEKTKKLIPSEIKKIEVIIKGI